MIGWEAIDTRKHAGGAGHAATRSVELSVRPLAQRVEELPELAGGGVVEIGQSGCLEGDRAGGGAAPGGCRNIPARLAAGPSDQAYS